MLPAARRLRRRGDFATTIRAGGRAGRGSVVAHVALPGSSPGTDANPGAGRVVHPGSRPVDSPPARVGFVVSRAVGGAVVRNKVRRRLRHLMRDRVTDITPGATVVIRAQASAAARSYQDLAHDVDAALDAARMAARRRGRTFDARKRREPPEVTT